MSLQQELKIKNFEEHLRIVLENISAANRRIAALYAERDSLEESVASLKNARDSLDLLVKTNIGELAAVRAAHEVQIANTEKVKEGANAHRKAVDEHIEKSLLDHASDVKVLDRQKHALVEEIRELEEKRDCLDDDILMQGRMYEDAKADYEEIVERKLAAEKSLEDAKNAAAQIYDIAKHAGEISMRKTAERYKEVQREEARIKEAAIAIEEREKAVKTREEDAAVLVRRIKKWYRENRPGLEPKL